MWLVPQYGPIQSPLNFFIHFKILKLIADETLINRISVYFICIQKHRPIDRIVENNQCLLDLPGAAMEIMSTRANELITLKRNLKMKNMNKLIFSGIILFSAAALASEYSIDGLGFSAPTINGKSNVSSPVVGEMVFDDSDDTFYGYNGTSWKAFGNNFVSLKVAMSSADQQIINNSDDVEFDTVEHDTDSKYTTADGKFECPSDGLYLVSGHILIKSVTSSTDAYLQVKIDGSPISQSYFASLAGTATEQALSFVETVDCETGEKISIFVSADDDFYIDSSNQRSRLSIQRIGSL